MKKTILFTVLAMLTLASCKKDYTCECYVQGSTLVLETYQLKDMKEKDAEAKCDSYDGTVDLAGQTVVKDCSLK